METHDYTDEMQGRRERVVRKLSVAKDKPGHTPEIFGPEVADSRWKSWASTVALALAVLLVPVLYFLYRSSPGLLCLIFLAFGLIYLAIGPDPDSDSNSTGGRVGSGDGGGDWGGGWGGDGGGDGD